MQEKRKRLSKFFIFFPVSSLPFSQVYHLDVGVTVKSLKRQVWFPDVIYPRLSFHPCLKHYPMSQQRPPH